MGQKWRRSFVLEIPVRDFAHWQTPEVAETLADTVGFLSDDNFEFRFTEAGTRSATAPYFSFGSDEAFEADEALLFSGGLDSLAGALDETLNKRNRVLLVSHYSATKLQRAQSALVQDLAEHVGTQRIFHVPVSLTISKGGAREHTHRTRSFFFAAICAALTDLFGLDRVRFYENGIVSLNLPPASQVIGSRATRSTHPQVLAGLSKLFSELFVRPIRVDNPFIWKTKTDIIKLIGDLNAAKLIRHARSCADVRNMTILTPHCGRCSQCLDRRFAAIAAGLADADPVEAYAIDPLYGPRTDLRDRELALGYAQNARQFATMNPLQFSSTFGEAQRAIRFLDEPASSGADRLMGLHKRHGAAVNTVIDEAMRSTVSALAEEHLDPNCLVSLIGQNIFSGSKPLFSDSHSSTTELTEATSSNEIWTIRMRSGPIVHIEGVGDLRGASANLIDHLAQNYLRAQGQGLAPEDHPLKTVRLLATALDIVEPTVRRRVNRARKSIAGLIRDAGFDTPNDSDVIENVAWKGYRLNPTKVRVFVDQEA